MKIEKLFSLLVKMHPTRVYHYPAFLHKRRYGKLILGREYIPSIKKNVGLREEWAKTTVDYSTAA